MEPSIVSRMDGPTIIHGAKRPTARKTNGAARARFGWEKRAGTKVGAFFRQPEKQTTSRNHQKIQEHFESPNAPLKSQSGGAVGDSKCERANTFDLSFWEQAFPLAFEGVSQP